MKSPRAAAFTLTELLITVTLLAVLLALSLSGVNAVRNAAQNGKCVANLRASGNAMLAYFTDRNGNFFPNKNWFQYPSTKPPPNNGMREYFGVQSPNYDILSPEFHHDTVLTCPAMKAKYPELYPQALNRGYAVNYYLFQKDPASKYDSQPSSTRPPLAGAPQNLRNVPRLSAMWMLSEAPVNGGLLGSTNESTAESAKNYLSMPHPGGAAGGGRQNVVFLDGHVESLTVDGFRSPKSKRDFWGKLTFPEN